jgi:protein-histidine pros-kinase
MGTDETPRLTGFKLDGIARSPEPAGGTPRGAPARPRAGAERPVTRPVAPPESATEERLRLAFEATAEGLWDWDLARNEVEATPRCAELLGWSDDELGSDVAAWSLLVHPADRDATRADLLAHLRGDTPRFECEARMLCGDGSRRWVLVRGKVASRDARGRARRMVGTLADATARHGAAEGIERALAAAEATAEARRDYLASLSHEIRTPMNGIVGMMELALDTDLTREQREYLQTARSSIDALLRIVNDVLDFSKIEAGRLALDRTEFSLRDCVEGACRTVASSAHLRGLELTCLVHPAVPERLEGDPGRLRQVLLNLLSNAIKFTERGEVSLTVSLHGGDGDEALLAFAVRDTGAGISAEAQSLVFEAFAQADPSITRRFGGTGLGLTIASRLAALMGGGIGLESAAGAGSTFTLSARFGVAADARPHRAPESLRGARVLAVDENATNRDVYRHALGLWGCDAVVATPAEAHGLVAEARAAGRPFALLVLDERTPGLAGRESAWRAGTPPETVVLATTAAGPLPSEGEGSAGFARRVLKPVFERALLDALQGWPDDEPGDAAAATAAARPVGSIERLRTGRALRVLITEDNLVNQTVAARVLERLGHSVSMARNGRECVEVWERGGVDVILMDVQMPVMDGIEATRVIRERERERGTRTPIIALTAHAMSGDRDRCLAAGMDRYLSKPIQIDVVAAALEALSDPEHPPSVPPAALDEAALMSSLDGDVDLALQLTAMFFDESEELLKGMWSSWRRGDAAALRMAVHSLKGALANFERGLAFETARRVEATVRLGDCAAVTEPDLVTLERETRRVAKALRAFVAKLGDGPEGGAP